MRGLLFFDSMITPRVITFIYWLLLLMVLFWGLARMFSGGVAGFITGLVSILVGAVVVRIWCELLIVFFAMQEDIRKIAKK